MKKKYDVIYSIGEDCACSSYLKKHNLRTSSGPFDWLTLASFETRMTLIANEFDRFLDKEDLEFLPKDPNISNDNHCDYYTNKRHNFAYYHDFKAGLQLDESFPAVKEKYQRRIDRFMKKIKEKERVLLIWFSHYTQLRDDEIKALCDTVSKSLDKKIDFAIIEHDETKQKSDIEKINLTGHITRYHLSTKKLDKAGNPTTMGNTKNCNKIFKQFAIDRPLGKRLSLSLSQNCVKLINLFIPVKVWRKSLRAWAKL